MWLQIRTNSDTAASQPLVVGDVLSIYFRAMNRVGVDDALRVGILQNNYERYSANADQAKAKAHSSMNENNKNTNELGVSGRFTRRPACAWRRRCRAEDNLFHLFSIDLCKSTGSIANIAQLLDSVLKPE